jgi:hypothetical protein
MFLEAVDQRFPAVPVDSLLQPRIFGCVKLDDGGFRCVRFVVVVEARALKVVVLPAPLHQPPQGLVGMRRDFIGTSCSRQWSAQRIHPFSPPAVTQRHRFPLQTLKQANRGRNETDETREHLYSISFGEATSSLGRLGRIVQELRQISVSVRRKGDNGVHRAEWRNHHGLVDDVQVHVILPT